MYATRLLSDLQKCPELLAALPDGPNSGYLVIQDEESKKAQSCLSWCHRNKFHKKLPFPQDKEVLVEHTDDDDCVDVEPVFFIPVLNRPLSHYCYYAIVPRGKHKGKAYTSSREEDMATTCFCFFLYKTVVDDSPWPLDPQNLYQQFKIFGSPLLYSPDHAFHAATLARDGFAPLHLSGRKDWQISFKTPNNNLKLDTTAQGLDPTLRARLPEFNLPLSQKPFVVGKWYSPFTFVKEGTVHEQVMRSMYYEVTLEQRWEKIFTCVNKNKNFSKDDAWVTMMKNAIMLESEVVYVSGRKARRDEKSDSGVVWYTSHDRKRKRKTSVGLRKEIVERMEWEQKRGGWIGGVINKDNYEVEKCAEGGKWNEFERYVLVERFNFRRTDGYLLMSCDFKHFHQTRTRWE